MDERVNVRDDKAITREIHRLFWEANFIDKTGLIISYLTRIPAVASYNILIPLVSAYAIEAIVAKQYDEVKKFAVWIMLLAVFYCIATTISGLAVSRNAMRADVFLQNKVFSNFLNKDYDFYSNAYFGALGSQVSRIIDAFNSYGELVTVSIPKQAVIVLAGVAVIAAQSISLAGVTLSTMALVLSFTILSSRWRLKYRRQVSEASSLVAGVVGDALSNGVTVKSYAAEEYEIKRLQKPLGNLAKIQFVSWISALPADAGRMLLAAGATSLLLIMSAKMYIDGDITLAIVVLIQLYVVKLIAATLDIAEMIKRYEVIMGSAYQTILTMRIDQSVTDSDAVQPISKSTRHTMTLNDVSYAYNVTTLKVVRGFSLTIKPGEKIGLVGFSGSGKTTLTKLLMRFMDVECGSIEIDGHDIKNLSQQELRKLIAYVPQEPLLFYRTIRENIDYGKPGSSLNLIEEAARTAYVDEFVTDFPDGLDTLVGDRGIKLSGGQRQRVAIARALLKDAPILLLDEATSALDSRSEQFIQKALWKLMKGRTAIVIAHRLSTIQRMDRIVVMDKGRIVQIGTHQELLDKPGIYAELWAHQSGGYIGAPDNKNSDDANTTSQK